MLGMLLGLLVMPFVLFWRAPAVWSFRFLFRFFLAVAIGWAILAGSSWLFWMTSPTSSMSDDNLFWAQGITVEGWRFALFYAIPLVLIKEIITKSWTFWRVSSAKRRGLLVMLLIAVVAGSVGYGIYQHRKARQAVRIENLTRVMRSDHISDLLQELEKEYPPAIVDKVFRDNVNWYCMGRGSHRVSTPRTNNARFAALVEERDRLERKKLAVLLAHGADVNAVDFAAVTPVLEVVNLAETRNVLDLELLALLLAYPVDLSSPCRDGVPVGDKLIELLEKDSRTEATRPLLETLSKRLR